MISSGASAMTGTLFAATITGRSSDDSSRVRPSTMPTTVPVGTPIARPITISDSVVAM